MRTPVLVEVTMSRTFAVLVAAFPTILLASTPTAAQDLGESVVRRGPIAQDVYLAGGTVAVHADVRGDVVAAGGRVIIDQRVSGDVLAAGGRLDLTAEVLDDVRVAGRTVTLGGRISGDAIAAGGTVRLTPEASVGERAWFGGGEIEIAGHIGRQLKASGGTVTISGTIDGDVELAADEVVLLPAARIGGKLSYRSPHAARIDPAAQITGGVTRLPSDRPSLATRLAWRLLWVAVVGLLGAVLILAFPRFAAAVVEAARAAPGKSLGIGVAALLGVPLLAVLLIVTVVGAALGVTLLVVYGLMLGAALLAGALSVGALISRTARGGAIEPAGSWVVALLLGLLVLTLLGVVPVLGALLGLGVMLLGLGALLRHSHGAWRQWRSGYGQLA